MAIRTHLHLIHPYFSRSRSSTQLEGSVPDLSLRLISCVILEGPEYASAPNFAASFVRTLIEGWSVDHLTELSNIYSYLRKSAFPAPYPPSPPWVYH